MGDALAVGYYAEGADDGRDKESDESDLRSWVGGVAAGSVGDEINETASDVEGQDRSDECG